MEFVSRGRLLAVVCFVCWTSVSLAVAATTTTQGQALWPDYANYSKKTIAQGTSYYYTMPFTYYECVTNEIVIYMSGYLSICGSNYERKEPTAPAEWPTFPKLFGVYWSKLTPYKYNENVSLYTSIDFSRAGNVAETSLIKYVKNVITEPDFEPLIVVTATWENVRPTTYDFFDRPQTGNETATFQVLLATDTRVTYAIRGYDSVWKSPEFANATYYAAAYSLGFGERPNISSPGSHAGPEVIRLGNKKPNKDAYTCLEKIKIVKDQLTSSLGVLPPCPCYQVQAATDQQFTTVAADPRCYQSKTPPGRGSLLQVCCYNQYGHLINYTREARVPVPVDSTDLRLQEAYEKCCAAESNLCESFYGDTYMTNCSDYTPAFDRSGLPTFANRDDIVIKSTTSTYSTYFQVTSSGPLTYGMLSGFNSSHGISFDGGNFNWKIPSALNELRKLTYPQRLVLYATDTNNRAGSYAPLIKLCLCQQDQQCNLKSFSVANTISKFGFNTFIGPESYEKGNVLSMLCDCQGNFTGRFCEKPINVCDNCLVNKTSGCDSNPKDYCPPCPGGYQRSGTQCLVFTPSTMPTTTPRNGGKKTDSTYFLIILSCITSYTLWIQNLPTTRM